MVRRLSAHSEGSSHSTSSARASSLPRRHRPRGIQVPLLFSSNRVTSISGWSQYASIMKQDEQEPADLLVGPSTASGEGPGDCQRGFAKGRSASLKTMLQRMSGRAAGMPTLLAQGVRAGAGGGVRGGMVLRIREAPVPKWHKPVDGHVISEGDDKSKSKR